MTSELSFGVRSQRSQRRRRVYLRLNERLLHTDKSVVVVKRCVVCIFTHHAVAWLRPGVCASCVLHFHLWTSARLIGQHKYWAQSAKLITARVELLCVLRIANGKSQMKQIQKDIFAYLWIGKRAECHRINGSAPHNNYEHQGECVVCHMWQFLVQSVNCLTEPMHNSNYASYSSFHLNKRVCNVSCL